MKVSGFLRCEVLGRLDACSPDSSTRCRTCSDDSPCTSTRMPRDLLREDTSSPRCSTNDTVVVVGEQPRPRTSLEDLFRQDDDSLDDSPREDVVRAVNRQVDNARSRRGYTRNNTSHASHTRSLSDQNSPRTPQVVVSFEQTHSGGKPHARTRVVTQWPPPPTQQTQPSTISIPSSRALDRVDNELETELDVSFKGNDSFAKQNSTPWNDRGSGFYEKQRFKCNLPALVATGTHAGRSLVKVRGRSLLKLLKFDAFTSLIEVHWVLLAVIVCSIHFVTFFAFAGAWFGLKKTSPACLGGFEKDTFNSALIFSIATQMTLGYGTRSIASDCKVGTVLLLVQIMVGVFVSALSLGLIFQRITDPQRRGRSIFVSDAACIAARDGELKFMFRVADARDRKVIAPVIRACLYTWNGRKTFEGEQLPVLAQPISISKLDPLMLLPITIENVIDENSPLFRHTHDSLVECGAEIVVSFEGSIDATGLSFSARQSYLPSEILWGHTFRRVIRKAPSGSTRHEVTLSRFHELEPQALLESPYVLSRCGVQLGGRALLTAQQMCEAAIENARDGGKNVTPFPVVGANTLVISDKCVVRMSNSSDSAVVTNINTLTFRIGDTRSPWGSQFVDVSVKAHLHVWWAMDTAHESFEQELKEKNGVGNGSDIHSINSGRYPLTLWAPVFVEHRLDESMHSPVLNAFCAPADIGGINTTIQCHPTLNVSYQDAVIVVSVEGTQISDGTCRSRTRCFRAKDVHFKKSFAQIINAPKKNKLWTQPTVDFGRFHDVV